MSVKKIIWGVMVLACVLPTSAMEYFKDSNKQYQPFRFKIEQGHQGIIFEDAPGSFLIQGFKLSLKESEKKIISLEEQNGENVKGVTEELKGLPEGSKRFNFEQYLSVLKEEGQILKRRQEAMGTYERLFFKVLEAIYKSEGKEVFCFAVPNFHVLSTKKPQDIPLNSLLVVTSNHGVEVMGESYVKLEIKGLPSDLFSQLNSFFYREGMVRAIELYGLKKKWIKKSKELYEVHKTYLNFNPISVSETRRLEFRIQKLTDEMSGIIEQLEPAWRMTETILAFQKEVFSHVSRLAQRETLESLKRDYPFERKKEDNDHDEQPFEKENLKEKKLEKKEEAETDPFLVISSENGVPELAQRNSVLEGGTRLLGKGVSLLRESGWLPSALGGGEGSLEKEEQGSEKPSPTLATPSTPIQGRWGVVSLLEGYSPFRASQQRGGQWGVLPESEQKDTDDAIIAEKE